MNKAYLYKNKKNKALRSTSITLAEDSSIPITARVRVQYKRNNLKLRKQTRLLRRADTTMTLLRSLLAVTLLLTFFISLSQAFQSDELLLDDEEFGLEGGRPQSRPSPNTATTTTTTTSTRKRIPDSASDSKIQFTLEHAFGDSDFSDAGNFSARLKTWSHGAQVPSLYSPSYSSIK